MRHQMVVSQLRPNAVTDQRVIAAMATLPRERFLPADVRGQAYRDTSIPLGEARFANLPMATARLLNAADLLAGDRVLLIGAAGGYTAAVLSEIVAAVVAVESLPALCSLVRDALADRSTVTLVEGPLGEIAAAGVDRQLARGRDQFIEAHELADGLIGAEAVVDQEGDALGAEVLIDLRHVDVGRRQAGLFP